MSHAHDCLVLCNTTTISTVSSLKRILRLTTQSDVTLTFDDGSRLIYRHADSWRNDRLEVLTDEV